MALEIPPDLLAIIQSLCFEGTLSVEEAVVDADRQIEPIMIPRYSQTAIEGSTYIQMMILYMQPRRYVALDKSAKQLFPDHIHLFIIVYRVCRSRF